MSHCRLLFDDFLCHIDSPVGATRHVYGVTQWLSRCDSLSICQSQAWCRKILWCSDSFADIEIFKYGVAQWLSRCDSLSICPSHVRFPDLLSHTDSCAELEKLKYGVTQVLSWCEPLSICFPSDFFMCFDSYVDTVHEWTKCYLSVWAKCYYGVNHYQFAHLKRGFQNFLCVVIPTRTLKNSSMVWLNGYHGVSHYQFVPFLPWPMILHVRQSPTNSHAPLRGHLQLLIYDAYSVRIFKQ